MSKILTKVLTFSAIVLTTVIGALLGSFMPEAALAVAVTVGAFAAGAAVAVTVGAFAAGAAVAVAVGAFAGACMALALVFAYYARKGN